VKSFYKPFRIKLNQFPNNAHRLDLLLAGIRKQTLGKSMELKKGQADQADRCLRRGMRYRESLTSMKRGRDDR
jgi:hypothetical protein